MRARSVRIGIGMAACVPALVIGTAGSAGAGTPTGSCTSSYDSYSYDGLAFDPAAQAIFTVIDANGDGYVCFKPYPNGPHAGHDGNLVDDKAAPHN